MSQKEELKFRVELFFYKENFFAEIKVKKFYFIFILYNLDLK